MNLSIGMHGIYIQDFISLMLYQKHQRSMFFRSKQYLWGCSETPMISQLDICVTKILYKSGWILIVHQSGLKWRYFPFYLKLPVRLRSSHVAPAFTKFFSTQKLNLNLCFFGGGFGGIGFQDKYSPNPSTVFFEFLLMDFPWGFASQGTTYCPERLLFSALVHWLKEEGAKTRTSG